MSDLDNKLNGLTKKSIGFSDHLKLKTALGISSRSLVHQYKLTGVYQQSPGYLTHLDGVAKAAKYIKWGGYVGIAVGGSASAVKVQNVCAKGDVEACEKIKYTETGTFVGGVAGGAFAGWALSTGATASICAALGPISATACGVVLVAGGSAAGGLVGEKFGEKIGEKVFEATKQ